MLLIPRQRTRKYHAEAVRRVTAGTAATGTGETWVDMATARGSRDRPRSSSGRRDGRSDIFRCIVLCENCNASECNKRMWYQLDNHQSHLCETCLRTTKLGPCGANHASEVASYAMAGLIFPFRVDG